MRSQERSCTYKQKAREHFGFLNWYMNVWMWQLTSSPSLGWLLSWNVPMWQIKRCQSGEKPVTTLLRLCKFIPLLSLVKQTLLGFDGSAWPGTCQGPMPQEGVPLTRAPFSWPLQSACLSLWLRGHEQTNRRRSCHSLTTYLLTGSAWQASR